MRIIWLMAVSAFTVLAIPILTAVLIFAWIAFRKQRKPTWFAVQDPS